MYTEDLTQFTASQLTNARSLDFARIVGCLADNLRFREGPQRLSDDNDRFHAFERFLAVHPRSLDRDLIEKGLVWRTKAVVNPGTTVEPSWAAPIAPIQPLTDAFVSLSRAQSLLGKLAVRPTPFNTSTAAQTSGASFSFIGQGFPKRVGDMRFAAVQLPPLKAAGVIVITRELLKLASPASVVALRNDLTRGMAFFLDQLLLDPTNVAVAGVSPGSITSTANSFGSAGSSGANALTDIKRLIADFTAANPNTDGLTLIASPATATAIALASATPDLGPRGGTYLGVPFVTSTAAGNRLVAVDASALLVADDGALDVSVSTQGTIELDSAPTSPITAGSVLVSLFQANCAGIKIDRTINWRLARPSAAVFTTVSYT